MPNYDYKCPTCQAEFKLSHSLLDTKKPKCGNCQVPLIKIYSAPGLAFKGGGWAHKE